MYLNQIRLIHAATESSNLAMSVVCALLVPRLHFFFRFSPSFTDDMLLICRSATSTSSMTWIYAICGKTGFRIIMNPLAAFIITESLSDAVCSSLLWKQLPFSVCKSTFHRDPTKQHTQHTYTNEEAAKKL